MPWSPQFLPVMMQQQQPPAPHSSIHGSYRADPCAQGVTRCLELELPHIPQCSDPWKGMSCHFQGAARSYGSLTNVPCEAAQQSLYFPSLPQIFVMNSQRKVLRPQQLAALTAALSGTFPVVKQGQCPQDLWTPGFPSDLPASPSPKPFSPFRMDEITSGSGKQ